MHESITCYEITKSNIIQTPGFVLSLVFEVENNTFGGRLVDEGAGDAFQTYEYITRVFD